MTTPPVPVLLRLARGPLRERVAGWLQRGSYVLLPDDGPVPAADLIIVGSDDADHEGGLRRVRAAHPGALVVILPADGPDAALDALDSVTARRRQLTAARPPTATLIGVSAAMKFLRQ